MTTNILRRIQPINIPASWKRNVAPKIFFPTWDTPPTPDMLPRVQMVKLFQLYINEEYQRKVGEKGHGLIRSMATDWNWSIFHLPVVTPCQVDDALEGLPTFEILDGQHTSIGALTNGSVREIPVLIVPAGTLKEKADNFVDLNTQRVAVSAPQIFWAKVAAGDECACLIKRAAEGAGAKIINKAPPYGDFAVGEISAVAQLQIFAKTYSEDSIRRLLEVGVRCGLAPIGEVWIQAFNLLLLKQTSPYYLEGDQRHQQVVVTVNKFGTEALHSQALINKASAGSGSRPNYSYLAELIHRYIVE